MSDPPALRTTSRVASRLGRALDRFLPEGVLAGNPSAHRRARLVVAAVVITGLLRILGGAIGYMNGDTASPIAIGLLGLATLGLLVPLRRGIDMQVIAHLYLASLLGGTVATSLNLGGLTVAYLWAMALLPLAAALIVGRRCGILWGIIMFLTIIFLQATIGTADPALVYPPEFLAWVRVGAAIIVGGLGLTLTSIWEAESAAALELLDRLNSELRVEAQKAESASAAKSDFLANMSHEIRTPMNGVIGLLSVLQESNLSREDRELVTTAFESAHRLLLILNDILDISKIEAGKLELSKSRFNLESLCRRVVKEMRLTAEEAGIHLKLEYLNEAEDYVIADPLRLTQVLNNLMSNAIKFTSEGAVTMRVSMMLGDERSRIFRFEIEDTGVGIPADRLGALFDKFTQADASTTRHFGGTGLGLAICRQLVEIMNGQIGVESEVGRGSCFWFELETKRCQQLSESIQIQA